VLSHSYTKDHISGIVPCGGVEVRRSPKRVHNGRIGWMLRPKITWERVAIASIAGSVVFFLISNFGVWVAGRLYPVTMSGLAACYVAALPFFRNSVLGDLACTAVMFGSYHLLRHRQAALTAGTP
jgi:hypothetical protein